WVAAELEAGGDQPSLVAARGGVDVGIVGGDPPGQSTDGLGGLGRIFRQVPGDLVVGDLAITGEPDGARINLGAPRDVPALRLSWVADGGEPGHAHDPPDDLSQRVGAEGRLGRKDPLRMDGSWPSRRKMAWK